MRHLLILTITALNVSGFDFFGRSSSNNCKSLCFNDECNAEGVCQYSGSTETYTCEDCTDGNICVANDVCLCTGTSTMKTHYSSSGTYKQTCENVRETGMLGVLISFFVLIACLTFCHFATARPNVSISKMSLDKIN